MGDAPSVAGQAIGNPDPVLALNLNAVADWSPQMPFLDLMKMSRPWIGHEPGAWGGVDHAELEARGLLDANGWPTEVPTDLDRIGTIFAWGGQPLAEQSRAGVYVLGYKGEGEIELGQDARVLAETPGRIVFENTGGAFTLDISATDPHGTANHIRDITIVPQQYQAFHEAGAVFNPDWLALVADARQIRFMDWMETNGSTQSDWADRPEVGDASWTADGVPVEVMVRLANQIGADPWFTLPHQATDAYVTAFATHVRDHLDPRLKAHVELSNEVWNSALPQHHDFAAQAEGSWGAADPAGLYLKQSTRTMQIWDDVFGAEAEARLVKVLAGQAVNSWATGKLLSAEGWKAAEPDAAIPPGDVFDAFAVATYFGGLELRAPGFRADLLTAIQDPGVDEAEWLHDRLTDPDHPGSLYHTFKALAAQKALASVHGLDLMAYEGGQHLHQHFSVDGMTATEAEQLHAFAASFVRSDHMAGLYGEMWDFWSRVGDGPFMQYTDVGAVGPFGSWGAVAGLTDNSPRSTLLAERNATAPRWWQDDRAETGFRHGVHREGDANANTLTGTSEEDFIAGRAGDDVLIAGPGDDGIHGGAGYDIARFSGTATAYVLGAYPGGYLLTGPDGQDVLVSIEELAFEDGTRAVPTKDGLELLPDGTGQRRSALPEDDQPDQFRFLMPSDTRTAPEHTGGFRIITVSPGEELIARARASADGGMFLDLGQGQAVVVEHHDPSDGLGGDMEQGW